MRKNPPLYQTVRDRLLERISNGELGVGDQLEPEVELAATYGVSRATMRSAIRDLVQSGMLVRRPGVGTQIVRSRPEVDASGLVEPLQALADSIEGARVLVLDAEITGVDAEIAAALRVGTKDRLLHICTICKSGDQLLAVADSWLSPAIGAGAAEARIAPLYSLVENTYNMRISHGTDVVDAVAADDGTAELLGVAAGSPVLTLERLAYDGAGAPLLFSRMKFRPGSGHYRVTLPRRAEN